MLKIMYVLIGIAIILGGLSLWFTVRTPSPAALPPVVEEPGTMCTMDAMQCPDGSYVGRTGPHCEFVCPESPTSTPTTTVEAPSEVTVTAPLPNALLATTTTVTGTAPGSWYFEGSFGVALYDGNGTQIAITPTQALSDWMTTSTVPFTATLNFTNPYQIGDPETMKVGILELHNDNPSGLPQNDKKLQIPVRFAL